ncbi:hypothetical protein [Lactiplantibacillus daowaiensis]|uniref:Uncharacterized protein n=1 Tax=Lactiplantibacillus daowaiensis TaxID=2559918 RepID=A0ABW1S2Q2_9LACO
MDNTAMPSWERHIGKLLIGLLVVVLLANAGWEVYRYGGKSIICVSITVPRRFQSQCQLA